MNDPLKIWKERKQFLEVELAKCADSNQKFTLRKQIEGCKQEIFRLQQEAKQSQQPPINLVTDIYCIQNYEVNIEVWPVELKNYEVQRKENPIIHCDNHASITYKVRFAKDNQCLEPFYRRYSTCGNGFIDKPIINFDNLCTPAENGHYNNHKNQVIFRFIPRSNYDFKMQYVIYNGFSGGNRDIHFHLNNPQACFYKEIWVMLNLEKYISSGFKVKTEPTFYFHGHDPQDHGLCERRELGERINPKVFDKSGQWKWKISNVDKGVIDLVWDLEH